MIISASRRTDIPAFYAKWFIERLREGFCLVPNPFNPAQVSRVSLRPEEVDVIVFWTRNPLPLFPYLEEMNSRGFDYYFLYTLMDNPRAVDRHAPSLDVSLNTFKTLAERIGGQKIIWRYDPILLTTITPPPFHLERYARIAEALRGYTARSMISFVELYKKATKRLRTLKDIGIELIFFSDVEMGNFLSALSGSALKNAITVYSCAQEKNFETYGIKPGKCIDDEFIERVFHKEVGHKKDPSQRKACGCVISKDIGMYDSCLYECQYCYATNRFDTARMNYRRHDPSFPCLIPITERKKMEREKENTENK